MQRKIPGQHRNCSYLLLPRQIELSVMTPDDNRPDARCAVLTHKKWILSKLPATNLKKCTGAPHSNRKRLAAQRVGCPRLKPPAQHPEWTTLLIANCERPVWS